jgi:hypothetical protein
MIKRVAGVAHRLEDDGLVRLVQGRQGGEAEYIVDRKAGL